MQARRIIESALAELVELGASPDSAATLLAIQGAARIDDAAYLETVADYVKALHYEAVAERRSGVGARR